MSYMPPLTITPDILNLVGSINNKTGRVGALCPNPSLHQRRENRIRTIHSSLAIEHNSLSLEQVTALLEGKHVSGPARDILEVQNAIEAYAHLDTLNPTCIEHLLHAHGMLMRGLTSDAGRFRTGNVGVFDGDTLIHTGTPANYVPECMGNLFDWLRSTTLPALLASCVFHYEFEFIHPFSDGNGRTGRLWQSLILGAWEPLFLWLPIETMVKENQQRYYQALAASNAEASSTNFVEFMLHIIDDTLVEALSVHGSTEEEFAGEDAITNTAGALLQFLQENPCSSLAYAARELGISVRQAERLASKLQGDGLLRREGNKRGGRWVVR